MNGIFKNRTFVNTCKRGSNYAKAVADLVKEVGGMPFLTDCNTLYPGSRKNALEHLSCAQENGFNELIVM